MRNRRKTDKIKIFINLHQNKLSILFILLFFFIITALLIWINTSEGILGRSYRDVYFYLIQGLRLSGYEIGGYEYVNYLSPLIPFLTSLLFRLGFINESSIFIVTGIFYPLGILGVYSLLKLRFNNIMSVFGSILYGCLSINLLWAANGTIDIPSVSLTIWAIYLMVLAVDKNQKYFYLGFPVAIIAFFAKYTAGLAIPLMIFYLVSKPNISQNIKKYYKNFFGGLIAGLFTAIPFFSYFYLNNIPLGFINQVQEIATSTTGLPTKVEMNNNLFYYFTNLPRFIYNPNHILSWLILAIVIIGLTIGIYKAIILLKNSYDNSNKFHKGKFKIFNKKISNKLYYILLFLSILIIGISFLTTGKISFFYSEIIFFLSILSLSYLMNKIINIYSSVTLENFNHDLLMGVWFFSYMIFFSAHLTKVDRYFTTMAPAFAFFVTLALNFIINCLDSEKIKNYIKRTNFHMKKTNIFSKNVKITNVKNIIPLVIIAILIISSLGYLTINKHDSIVHDERATVKWLSNYDNNYQSKVIWAERGPIFTWYMKKEVIYVNWLIEPSTLSKNMLKNNTTYFISVHENVEIPSYSKIKTIGEVSIYEKSY
ncbi:MAG: glycosyltransferase family 39 protein [Methanobacteriaceae archaeon]|nr:glycosyltransferase family 39 protein [Candidatus Methanorudis spinitermitis]